MRLLVCMILPLAAWCAPAVVNEESPPEDSLKPVIRTKRADEQVVFGNHQNQGQVVKKSIPSSLMNDENVIDKLDDDEPESTENDDVMETDADKAADVLFSDDAKSIGDMTQDGDMIQEGDEDGEEEEGKDGKGDFLEDENIIPDLVDDTSGKIPMGDNVMQNNDLNYDDYYDYFSPYGRYRRNTKSKRATPEKQLTADNMEDPLAETKAVANQRHKRDLTTDELAQWLENGEGNDGVESSRFYPEYDVQETADPWEKLALEELLEKEYPEVVENNSDYPLYPDYQAEEEEDPEKERELLSLLEYLESESPEEEARDIARLHPEDVQEQWQDLDLDPEVPYEPIIYNGIPGIFIPTDGKESTPEMQKRQYLSMVPGVRKRDFQYPFHLEPEGGRWGAFVPPQEEKRDSDAYERLYRLAAALNADRYYSKK